MNAPRKHHYCPQSYLAGFTKSYSNTGRLFVFDKQDIKERIAKPKNEAHQRDFYRLNVMEGEDPFLLEGKFSEIEEGAKKAINEIKETKKFPSDVNFNYLINFLGLMAVRTSAYRNRISSWKHCLRRSMLKPFLEALLT